MHEYIVAFTHCNTGSEYTMNVFAEDDDKALEEARRKLRAHMSFATLPNWKWAYTFAK